MRSAAATVPPLGKVLKSCYTEESQEQWPPTFSNGKSLEQSGLCPALSDTLEQSDKKGSWFETWPRVQWSVGLSSRCPVSRSGRVPAGQPSLQQSTKLSLMPGCPDRNFFSDKYLRKHLKDSQTVRKKILGSEKNKDWMFLDLKKYHVWRKPGTSHHLFNTSSTGGGSIRPLGWQRQLGQQVQIFTWWKDDPEVLGPQTGVKVHLSTTQLFGWTLTSTPLNKSLERQKNLSVYPDCGTES